MNKFINDCGLIYKITARGKKERITNVLDTLNIQAKRLAELKMMVDTFLSREEFKHIENDSEAMQ